MHLFVRIMAAISFLALTACGAPQKPPLKVAEGYTAGNYHISKVVIEPTKELKEQSYGSMGGTLDDFEEFKKNALPVLNAALSKEKKGPALKMEIDVGYISTDINKLKAILVTDGVAVVTVVRLVDVSNNTVVVGEKIGITSKMQSGLFDVITDSDTLSHEQNQKDLAQKYVQRLMYKLFPGKYPFI